MGPPPPHYVCECLKVTGAALLKAIHSRKIQNIKDIIRYTQAGDGCTACHPLLTEYLAAHRPEKA